MTRYKNFVILHSNDLHGDFFEERDGTTLSGGISRLSGYITKVRQEHDNVLYTISGDMFRGSIIDTEFKGISTIEIINLIAPDAVTLGNHEIDYGIAHLLFIEKMAKFPILNANLYIKNSHTRLFKPYAILERDGLKILVIGIITEDIVAAAKQDELIGSFISVEEAAREVVKICNNYKSIDIDFTIVLSHIGIENDIMLAELIDRESGVDLILGGHSHTYQERPAIVNGILIAHAGYGSDQVGRFDIVIDTDLNCVHKYKWGLVKIDENAPRDIDMEEVLHHYQSQVDGKYERIVTKLDCVVTHPKRNQETSLGNLFSDVIRDTLGIDVMLVGSGSIRGETLGPVVKYLTLKEIFPYDDAVYMVHMYGYLFRRFVKHMLRDEAFSGHTEFYQFSKGIEIKYSRSKKELLHLKFNGEEIKDDDVLTVGIQNFHFANLEEFFNITYAEAELIRKPRVISTSCLDLIDEYLSSHGHLKHEVEGRIVIAE